MPADGATAPKAALAHPAARELCLQVEYKAISQPVRMLHLLDGDGPLVVVYMCGGNGSELGAGVVVVVAGHTKGSSGVKQ